MRQRPASSLPEVVLPGSATKVVYVVAENRIVDAEAYRVYAKAVLATLTPYGGVVLARAGASVSLEGPPPERIVIIAFDSVHQAQLWWDSPEYRAILPTRLQAAVGRVYISEGLAEASSPQPFRERP